jgi:hypothetical protein
MTKHVVDRELCGMHGPGRRLRRGDREPVTDVDTRHRLRLRSPNAKSNIQVHS